MNLLSKLKAYMGEISQDKKDKTKSEISLEELVLVKPTCSETLEIMIGSFCPGPGEQPGGGGGGPEGSRDLSTVSLFSLHSSQASPHPCHCLFFQAQSTVTSNMVVVLRGATPHPAGQAGLITPSP